MLSWVAHLDQQAFIAINSAHAPLLDLFFLALTQMGNGWVIVPILAVMIILKYRKKCLRPVLVCASALILGGVVNNGIKCAVERPRPLSFFVSDAGSTRAFSVHAPGEHLTARSFPSGHTNTAFVTATLVIVFLGRRWWPVFILAAFTGYSRIYLGVHFPLDVAVGAVLGYAIAAGVVHLSYLRKPALETSEKS